eukprot:TRINITY_DN35695_c0_g1_i1.p1 TRINITY_DN35695_c0_g1~~TRINITY_DN35695_c0_g1_i1.p1  ORF type:complete len:299 (+),score=73.31 TRINITY_DN35695_c0_g1_i1:52-948(+)
MARTHHFALRQRRSSLQLTFCTLALLVACQGWSAMQSLFLTPRGSPLRPSAQTLLRASILDSLENPIKTVSETIADFYKAYPQPPVLPMYRAFLVDFLTQTHLAVVDSRFKYDAIYGLGMVHYFKGLMSNYDKLVSSQQSGKIWAAICKSLDLNPDEVNADAEAMKAYATSTSPADILQHLEGAASPSDARVGEAFSSIQSKLYTLTYSVGLFKLMELSGIELSKGNVEEWAKALKITPPSKVGSDLETYKQNQNKLQKAEEMMREIEIREKKKLAERLEQKAKALAEKAAQASAKTE